MDQTLVKTKSGAKFAKNAEDWLYWHDNVPKIIKQLANDKYKLIIYTNQKGISIGKTQLSDIQ